MKNRRRVIYLICICLCIMLGLYSRSPYAHISLFKEYGGDILWTMMFYFIFAFIFLYKKPYQIFLYAVVFSFIIEFTQALQWTFLVYLRSTFMRLLLGQGFVWSDLLCYSLGACYALLLDIWIRKTEA